MGKRLKFYNVKTKKSFYATNYKYKVKGGRRFAVAKNAGIECWRVLGRA